MRYNEKLPERLYREFAEINPERAQAFQAQLRKGFGLTPGNPVYELREDHRFWRLPWKQQEEPIRKAWEAFLVYEPPSIEPKEPKKGSLTKALETAAQKRAPVDPETAIPPSRQGKRAIAGFFDQAVSRQLRQLALDRDTSIQALLTEALNDLFTKYGRPPIA
jgi:hypothetical protein